MSMNASMEHIIELWPSLVELARDMKRPVTTISSWKQRGSIPAKYDLDLISCAKKRGMELTLGQISVARHMAAYRRTLPDPRTLDATA